MEWPSWVAYPPKVTDYKGNPYNSKNPPSPSSEDWQYILNSLKQNLSVNPDESVLKSLFDYYFAQFEPYITDDQYKKKTNNLDGSSIGSSSGIYNKRFINYVTMWASKSPSNKARLGFGNVEDSTNSFAIFLEEDENTQNLRSRYFNVMFYCIDKLLVAMKEAQNTQMLFSKDMTKYYYGMLSAQTGMSGVEITELTGSDINPQLADPNKLAQQQMDLLEIEKYRQAFNLSRDRSRQSEANLQFAKESNSQFVSSMETLFQRQELALKSVIKS